MNSNMLEVLFCCDTSENQVSCSAWDFRTGTLLMNYKGASVQPRSLCIRRAEHILAANIGKPLMHVWPINAQEQVQAVRFVLPGLANALALSPDGCYLIAGVQESLYIWHLTTGRMLNTIAKHYQPVNCLRFCDDSSHFISAGQDGSVLVWNLTQVVSRGDDNQSPLYSFNDHGLPVTDVHVGAGGVRAYMLTVSLDRTCKLYDLNSGTLLLNVVFAEGLQSVTSNSLETCVYVGTTEGNIYEFHIDALPRTKEYHISKDQGNILTGHKKLTAVSCLSLSLDGQSLVSGGQDQQVCIWHIPSRQLLKAMPHKGAITDIMLRLTNPAIFHAEHKQPRVFGGNLRRMLEPPDADEELIVEVLVTEHQAEQYTTKRIRQDVVAQKGVCTEQPTTLTSSTDVDKLRTEVQHLKCVNKKLFEVSAKHLLARGARKK